MQAASGTLSYVTDGDDVIVTIASGTKTTKATVKLKNAAALQFVTSANNKNLYVLPDIETIDATADNQTLTQSETDPSTSAYFRNTGYSGIVFQPSGGSDTIETSEDDAEQFWFGSKDGNNLITSFGKGDTLRFTDSKGTISTETVGGDVIATLKGTSTSAIVTLGGAASENVSLKGKYLVVPDPVETISATKNKQKISGTGNRSLLINDGFTGITMQGNSGNDTYEGSDFAEKYIVNPGDGNNLVVDFGAGDTLQTTNTKASFETLVSGDDVIVTVKNATDSAVVTLGGVAANENVSLVAGTRTLYATSLVETIPNYKENVTINGTSTVDVIVNYDGQNVTINPLGGNDTIYGSEEYGDLFRFNYASGDNVIMNFGEGDTLYAADGTLSMETVDGEVLVSIKKSSKYTSTVLLKDISSDLTLVQSGKYITVDPGILTTVISDDNANFKATDDKWYVEIAATNVTVDGNGGNDTIESSEEHGNTILFDAIDGNDVVVNFSDTDVVRLMSGTLQSAEVSGNDYVITAKYGSTVGTITIKDNTDIVQRGNYFTTKDVVKEIINRQDDVKVSGTAFSDRIINTGDHVTINGRGGNDTIATSSNAEVIQFGADGGQDYVTSFEKNDTLHVVSGSVQSTLRNGDDIIVNVKSGSYTGTITLGGAGGYLLDSTVKSDGQYLMIDSVNQIVNRDDNVTITGSSKKDWISNSGEGVTIRPGAGNDTIEGSHFAEMYTFAYSTGNNVITNFGANDSIKATSGTMTYSTVGDDVIVTIASGTKKSTIS